MSVNSVNFSTMGAAPLKPNRNVSFAGQEAQEPKKSNAGKYVAAGLSLATIAAAIVFRKDISKMASNIWKRVPASVTNKVAEGISKAKDVVNAGINKTKDAFQKVTLEINTFMSNVGTKISNFAKTAWKGVKTCAKAVSDFFVKMFNVVKSWFAKPQATQPVQVPPNAVV